MAIRSVQIWTCPCGISYRAVSELELPVAGSARNLKTSAFECPSCHRTVSLDGEPIQISFEMNKEKWVDVPQSGNSPDAPESR